MVWTFKEISSPEEVSIASPYQPEMTVQQNLGSPNFKSRQQSPSPLKTSTESRVSQKHFPGLLWEPNAVSVAVLSQFQWELMSRPGLSWRPGSAD